MILVGLPFTAMLTVRPMANPTKIKAAAIKEVKVSLSFTELKAIDATSKVSTKDLTSDNEWLYQKHGNYSAEYILKIDESDF